MNCFGKDSYNFELFQQSNRYQKVDALLQSASEATKLIR